MPTSRKFTNANLIQNPPDILDDELSMAPPDIDDETPPDIDDEIPDVVPEIVSHRRGAIPSADSFGSGFIRSVLGGDAYDAGIAGAKGWAKGAVDLPSTIMGMINAAKDIPGAIRGIPAGLQAMWETTKNAGANPEEFGYMMGQQTGQPLATAGLVKGAPSVIRGAGIPTEFAGRVMKNYAPMSGTIPRMIEPRIARVAERAVGKGIESVGKKMRVFGKDGKVIGPADTPFVEGQALEPEILVGKTEPVPIADQILSKDSKFFTKNKPKVRLLPDGNYVNLDTGEIFDSMGKPMAAPVPKTRAKR